MGRWPWLEKGNREFVKGFSDGVLDGCFSGKERATI